MGKKKDGAEPEAAENIRVVVRCRPLSLKEMENGYTSNVELNLTEHTVAVNHVCGAPDRWTFDAVVNNTYSQKDIFTQHIMPLVDSVLGGFNTTVFAYGQSGSGKTHTMTGKWDDLELQGIIPRTFMHIFSMIKQSQATNPNKKFTVYCSFIELYLGKVRDLLAKNPAALQVKENKDKTFYVQGALQEQVKFQEDLVRLLEEGTERRQVGSTELNADSSRSHSVFTLIIESSETSEDGDVRSVTSKLNLVDLAGSERQSKTGASGDTLKEGCNINLSLSALGTVIDSIVKGKGHIPFRSSPLTMLLKDSLGGSSKTVMFANIGPSEHNTSETVSTLRFADRAKQIKNKPVVNMDSKDQKIAELTEVVNDLKKKLKQFESGGFAEMETELEELRDRVSELETENENLNTETENQRREHERERQAAQQEQEALAAERDELRDTIARAQQEVAFAESCLSDEQRQREEMSQICSDFLETDISNISELGSLFAAKKAALANNDEVKQLSRQLKELQLELKRTKDSEAAELAKEHAVTQELTEELAQANKKLNKMKAKLSEEKEARKQLVQAQDVITPSKSGAMAASASNADVTASQGSDDLLWIHEKKEMERRHRQQIKALKDELKELQDGGSDSAQVAALTEQLDRVRSEKEKSLNKMQQELAKTTQLATAVSEDDTKAVAHLKELVTEKDAQLSEARRAIDALEDELAEIRTQRLTRTNSQVHELAGHREDEHAKVRKNLRKELATAATQRDELLLHIAESEDSGATIPVDLKEKIVQISKENAALRTRNADLEEENNRHGRASYDNTVSKKLLEEQIQQLEDTIASLKGSRGGAVDTTEVDELREQVAQQQDELAAVRKDFAEREREFVALLSAAEGAEGADGDNPLQSVVAMLQRDKEALTEEASKAIRDVQTLQYEVREARAAATETALLEEQLESAEKRVAAAWSQGQEGVEHEQKLRKEAEEELAHVQKLLSEPRDSDSDEVKMLREEVGARDKAIAALKAESEENRKTFSERIKVEHEAANVESPLRKSASPTLASRGRSGSTVDLVAKTEIERVSASNKSLEEELGRLRSEVSRGAAGEVERKAVESDLEQLRSDMADEVQKRETAQKEYKAALEEIANAKNEVGEANARLLAAEGRNDELATTIKRMQDDSHNSSSIISQLEGKLNERSTQLESMRNLLQQQKSLMEKMKEKQDGMTESLKAVRKEAMEREKAFQAHMAEQEEAIHKAMNKRIEQLSEEHHRALARKDEDVEKEKKRVKKMQNQVQKVKEKYDAKVCDYEELKGRLEELKVDAMKQMRERNEGKTAMFIEDQQNDIRDIVKLAKEDRAKRMDIMGDRPPSSNLAQYRAAGTATMLARANRDDSTYQTRSKHAKTAYPPPSPPTDLGDLTDGIPARPGFELNPYQPLGGGRF